MRMDFSLNLVQEQKLIMTQQMQLSVKLLQMSTFELQQFVDKELQENPVLEAKCDNVSKEVEGNNRIEYKELAKYLEFDNYSHRSYEKNEDDEVSPLNFISEKKSLKEYLKEQILESGEDNTTKSVCEYIVGNLDERGYLDSKVEELAEELNLPVKVIENSLKVVQSFEPNGIAARDLKECLMIQLLKRGITDEKLFIMIDDYLEALAENKYLSIAKQLSIDVKEAQRYGDIIKSLEPKPSRGFYTGEEVKYIMPDAYIRKINNEFHIIMNEEILPRLNINEVYREILSNETDKLAIEYVKEKINSAMFLMKSIEQRKSTIYRVLERIIELQKEYFDYGVLHIKPMTLKDIADSLEMHESTISRAIKDKFIYTSNGMVKIKDLFTTGMASSSEEEDISVIRIKNQIKELVEGENKSKPLSDQVICDMLNDKGMNISRRTVAKYREELGIKSSSKRKRF